MTLPTVRPADSKPLRYAMLFVLSVLMFIAINIVTVKWHEPHSMDFSIYWMAGKMVMSGKNVYNPADWALARSAYGLRPDIEPWFHYPLPLAILFIPISLFPILQAYDLWVFLSLCAALFAILILLDFYPKPSPIVELMIMVGVFLFRPMYIVFLSGQILSFIFFFAALSIYLSKKDHWFWAGFILSFVNLKPAFGFFILALMGLWYLFNKKWRALTGILSGSLGLLALGLVYDPHWITAYLSVGRQVFEKYLGMQTTLWGITSFFLHDQSKALWIGGTMVAFMLAAEIYILARPRILSKDLPAMATVLPVALLIAPYSWSYDQFILILPMIYVSIEISKRSGVIRSVLFVFLVDLVADLLVVFAQSQGLDVWSALISFLLWGTTLYFVFRPQAKGG